MKVSFNLLVHRVLPWIGFVALALFLTVFVPVSDTLWTTVLGIAGTVNTGEWLPTPTFTPTPNDQAGTTLEAEKTAFGFSEEGRVGVRGEICVSNGGEQATENLTILDQVQYKAGPEQYEDLPGASQTIVPLEQLGPGQSGCYAYEILFEPVPDAHYRNVARVTITNHSGWMPGGNHCPGPDLCPFGPEPKADFNFDGLDLLMLPPTETPTATPTETATSLPTSTETPTDTPTMPPTATPECPGGNYFSIPMDRCWPLTEQPDEQPTDDPSAPPHLQATIQIQPDIIVLAEAGDELIAALIELDSSDYRVTDIKVQSIRLCLGSKPCTGGVPARLDAQSGDADKDGIVDLKVFFDRALVTAALSEITPPASTVLTVWGLIVDKIFVGCDTISLLAPTATATLTSTPTTEVLPTDTPTLAPPSATPTSEPPTDTPTPEPPTNTPTPEPPTDTPVPPPDTATPETPPTSP